MEKGEFDKHFIQNTENFSKGKSSECLVLDNGKTLF